MNFYFNEMSGGKMLYARPTTAEIERGKEWRKSRTAMGMNIRNEEDAARGKEIREKYGRHNQQVVRNNWGMRKANVHDRLSGKAPIAYVQPKKV